MRPLILMYHSITADAPLDPYAVSRKQLEDHINCLMGEGFQFIPLADYIHGRRIVSSQGKAKQVILTFDDGYQDFLTNALPVLLRYQLAASVFLVTERLGKTSIWNRYAPSAQLMTEMEIHRIRAEGISLGSHTLNHVDLTTLDAEELHRELDVSRKSLSEFGEIFFAFSYPWGRHTKREVAAVKAAGYDCALIASETADGPEMEPFTLGRFVVRRDMSLEQFKYILLHRTWIKKPPSRIRRIGRQMRRSLFSSVRDRE